MPATTHSAAFHASLPNYLTPLYIGLPHNCRCNKSGGSVVAQYPTMCGSPSATTNLDCRWNDALIMDTSAVAEAGLAAFHLTGFAQAPSDVIKNRSSGLLEQRLVRVMVPLNAGLSETAGIPCRGEWCNWEDFRVHSLTAVGWSHNANYTSVSERERQQWQGMAGGGQCRRRLRLLTRAC